ncbi:hypothetical protein LSH36_540g01046, partial [Paralvinella palmiformis]
AVIKAWDIGVATMHKGEVAVFTCKPEYAYGEAGSPPTIPPGATLVFEVELFDWQGSKDEGIIRTLIHKGTGYTSPSDGATCEVHITGLYNGKQFEDRDVKLVLGEGSEADVVLGVELGLKKFKSGEKSKLKIKSEYAYGEKGHNEYNIPPGADLEYEVTLKTFEKSKESWEMDTAEKLEQSGIAKQKGTDYFKQGKFSMAKKYYKKIVDYLESDKTLEGEEKEKCNSLLLAGHLNLAMCCLKLGQDHDAMDHCDKALELDPKSEKGLFRRGSARMAMKDYPEAIEDFNKVLELDPNNKAAKNQVLVANAKIREVREREKKIYAGMFQKFAQADAKKEAAEKQRLWNSELTIDEWSNSMADGMMSLQQEKEKEQQKKPQENGEAPEQDDTNSKEGESSPAMEEKMEMETSA